MAQVLLKKPVIKLEYVLFALGWVLSLTAMDLVSSQAVADALDRMSVAFMAAAAATAWARHRRGTAIGYGILATGRALLGPHSVGPRTTAQLVGTWLVIALICSFFLIALIQFLRFRKTPAPSPISAG